MSSKVLRSTLVALLVGLCIFTRFVKLDWGDGYFFQPDENNMASAVSQLTFTNLNPNFYAYGQFPLYLTYFSGIVLNYITHTPVLFKVSFPQAILILRFYSALASIVSAYFAYLISNKLFSSHTSRLIATILIIFNPGLIQLAHFGTTESLLILVFLASIYFSLLYAHNPQSKYLLYSSLFAGVGLSSKLTALIFIVPIFLALLFNLIKKFSWKYLAAGFLFTVTTVLLAIILSPYNILRYKDFISSMAYETQVATGSLKVFYTNQFLYSTPYFFQLSKIFPYSAGISMFTLSVMGILLFFAQLFARHKPRQFSVFNWSLIIFPCFIYFLYFGQVYTKWFRFMSPIFFLIPLFATLFIVSLKNKYVQVLLTLLAVLPGIIFLKIYFQPDIRLQFSRWFEQNIPANTTVLSEAGNVMNIPLTAKPYDIINFDFYNLDQSVDLVSQLPETIAKADYILVPSRRIFKNQTNSNFPYSQSYYYNLFLGKLGFTPMATFKVNNTIFLDFENAEETFSVFDQPTIRLYKKTTTLNQEEIYQLLVNSAT